MKKLHPATKEYIRDLGLKIFVPLCNDKSTLMVALYKSGTHGAVNYIRDHSYLLGDKYPEKIAGYNWIDLDMATADPDVILGALCRHFDQDPIAISWSSLLAILTGHTTSGQKYIFVVNNAQYILQDKQLWSILEQLYRVNSSAIKFLFIFNKELESADFNTICSQFGVHNIVYVPLKDDADEYNLIKLHEVSNKAYFTDATKERIVKLAGGYSSIARTLISMATLDEERFATSSNTELLADPLVMLKMTNIYSSFSLQTQASLYKVLFGRGSYDEFPEFVKLTKVIKLINDKYALFSPLFERFLLTNLRRDFLLREEGGDIYLYGVNTSELLTNQEYLIFNLLYANRGKIVSKDEIAETIWGGLWIEKYSDATIDTVLHNIRMKLKIKGTNWIESVKRRGVRLNL